VRARGRLPSVAATALFALSCGGIQTVSRDGYRALLLFSSGERYQIAVRGERRRVEGIFDGSILVKILRPDLGKIWQYRPSTRKIFEEPWSQSDELVPGFPLEPHFDPAAYAQRFGGAIRQIGDGVHGIHPCDRYMMGLPSGDRVTIWAARDFERLPVRIEHERKGSDGLFHSISGTQLLDVRIGAAEKLFEKPKGYAPVNSYAELSK
jgi:hypothetical protein